MHILTFQYLYTIQSSHCTQFNFQFSPNQNTSLLKNNLIRKVCRISTKKHIDWPEHKLSIEEKTDTLK